MTNYQTGARLIARTLQAYGVSHVFFMDAILRRALAEMEDVGITRVLGHSEKGVAYMADGFARVSGRPGVCMAQSVGAANLAAAMQDPFLGQSPVIAITGRHAAAFQYRNAYQEVPHDPLFDAVTKFSARIELPEQITHLFRQAFREATTGTPRPVHLDVAGISGDTIAAMQAPFDVVSDEVHSRFPAFRPGPDPRAIERAVAALARSVRPVVVADRGVIVSDAVSALHRFAGRIQAPVVVTLDAKAAMLDSHALFRGPVGSYGIGCANHVVAESDLVIYAGSHTSDHTTGNWNMPAQGSAVIQIDLDPIEIGRNYPGVVGIQSDVRAALEALGAAAGAERHDAWLEHTRRLYDQWRRDADVMRASDQVPMRPERLCRELSEVLPENAVLIADTGFSALWSGTLVELRHPGQGYFRAAGSLGWAFPASLGAKCAAPDRPVICFTGDGGFYYHLPELETARRRGINTITVVNNNHCLAQGLRNLNIAYEGRSQERKSELFEYRPTDFAKVAQSFDCFGVTVERPSDFRAAFAAAMASGLPAVIDVKTEFGALAELPWVPT